MPLSVRERIYEAIRDEITYGELLPGERLTEKELSEKFQASRSTIRECLRQLESEGLLTFESHKGFRVSKLSTRQVEEIYDLRWLLESYATRLTAEKTTPAQVAHLEKLQEGCGKAAHKSDLKAWLKYNTAFHNFFYENCGNDNLKLLLDTLKRRIYRYQYIIIQIPGHFENYLAQHEKIIEACRHNDGRAAEKQMQTHLRGIKKVLLEQFEKFPAMHPG
ncbi:MAG: GntR family transcriptional regulator [Proteobacteria bacterium]|nr:GntR family transcriptional regulator [Pseudomonadota bacterium]MBU1451701.1 GntR family transcriptional regulator [Pseudomonadota bacterium]MBU2467619.1 GntR family transcriptional regulator [Pseudomonadota bacterium]MBU2516127.1 GntR family transcriptional regulator [Pseudomonadota bacterium]